MNSFSHASRSALAISALLFGAYGVTSASDGDPLTDDFRRQFTNRNPVLTEIQILESRPLSSKTSSGHRVYLVHAIRPDHKFEGKFEDEQFGVFLVNVNQNRIVTVLDMFNTPRWADYEIKIKRASPSKVTVRGRGASYGDQPIEKTYDIGGIR
jgi:hypothetical protein